MNFACTDPARAVIWIAQQIGVDASLCIEELEMHPTLQKRRTRFLQCAS